MSRVRFGIHEANEVESRLRRPKRYRMLCSGWRMKTWDAASSYSSLTLVMEETKYGSSSLLLFRMALFLIYSPNPFKKFPHYYSYHWNIKKVWHVVLRTSNENVRCCFVLFYSLTLVMKEAKPGSSSLLLLQMALFYIQPPNPFKKFPHNSSGLRKIIEMLMRKKGIKML